ncbi:MAG: RHS repeat-associated core domain-containing protein, partial [Thermodesulfobacteriota bacterium]
EPNGFYYMRARYYDPEVRRFISEDPIGFNGGDLNLYAYVGNNPMMMVDPSGNLAAPWHFVITYAASRDAGNGILASLKNGWDAMAVDFAAGSQEIKPDSVVQHAMGMPGQSTTEAIANTQAYIQNSANPLANRNHAAQDLVTPAHGGQEWVGFGWNWKTVSHIVGDLFPSWNTITQAYQSTLNVMTGVANGGGYK